MNQILKIGHRGACGYEPENTLKSFEKAIELKVDAIELDVIKCASGEIVVIHDDTVDRTTNGKGKVEDLTLSDLQKLDAGKGERIPTLQQALDLINKRCKVNIELKGSDTALKTYEIIKDFVSSKRWEFNDFLISSFNFKEIKSFKDVCDDIAIGLLFYLPANYIKYAKEFNAQILCLDRSLITKQVVEDAHKNNLKVFVYTVNETEEIKKLKELHVDGIFCNYPDKLS